MLPPADLAPLRALIEAVSNQHTHACHLWIGQDCSCARRFVPAAREALERVEVVMELIDDDKRELVGDIKRGRERAGVYIARLEAALQNAKGELLYAPVWLCPQCLEGTPCEAVPSCTNRERSHARALAFLDAALEGHDE